jgi:ATP-dependent RNA helicase RhlE
VVNYELPNVPESYVHRIGRTARAGAAGVAISLCSNDERSLLKDIQKLTRQTIPSFDRRNDSSLGALAAVEEKIAPDRAPRQPGHGRNESGPSSHNRHRGRPAAGGGPRRGRGQGLKPGAAKSNAGGRREAPARWSPVD